MTRTVADLNQAIEIAKAGGDCMVRCSAHEDGTASLHVSPGRDQPVVLKCHAGCETDAILAAEGLGFDAILGERDPVVHEEWTPAGPASHVYSYTDEQGVLLFQTLRIPLPGEKKTFRQRHRGPDGRWVWNMAGVRRVLYRLPDVVRARSEGTTIYVVEGEKDVHTLIHKGLVATTMPMGAGKWLPEYTQALAGANVILITDADATGRAHARHVRKELQDAGCTVTVYEPAEGAKDISEHIGKGLGFRDLIETVPEEQDRPVRYGVDILDLVRRSVSDIEFVIPNTLARGDRLLITGWEGHGKDLALDTPILTTDGWTTMGEVRVGQQVFDENGHPCTVVSKSEVMVRDGDAYRVSFSDGSHLVAGETHEWVTYTERERARLAQGKAVTPSIRSTKEIRDTLRVRSIQVANHAVPVAGALVYPEADLPLPPYTLGAWLGDGSTDQAALSIASRDLSILDGLRADGQVFAVADERNSCRRVGLRGVKTVLRQMGVLGDKHIPRAYLSASVEQRLSLLAGICDTDGHCSTKGMSTGRGNGDSAVEVTFTHERLARDTLELVRSLGLVGHLYEGDATIDGRFISRKYRVVFRAPFNPFRHAEFKAERWRPLRTARSQYRYITAVEPVERVETQCIQVDSASHLYLAGRDLIPTHNSTLLRQMAVQVAAGIHPWSLREVEPKRVLVIDAENHPDQTLTSWQDLVGLAARHDHPLERGMLTVLEEWDNDDLDLLTADGHAWLAERVHGYRPDLVVMGPLTNMAGRDLKDDETVRKIKAAVNTARSICGTAFVMEHHAPHKGPNDRERPLRPYGSSMFLKWPDFGYGLKPTEDEFLYEFIRTRFPRVRSRSFPEVLRAQPAQATDWPWTVAPPT